MAHGRRIRITGYFAAFCNTTHCRNLTPTGNGLLYSDETHLTKGGSATLVAHFRADLERWLGVH